MVKRLSGVVLTTLLGACPLASHAVTTFEGVGLQWVADPSIIYGSSRNDIESQMVSGGQLEGFRYATLEEFNSLVDARYSILKVDAENGSPGSYDAVIQLVEDFGLASYDGASSNGFEIWSIILGTPTDAESLGGQPGEFKGIVSQYYHTLSSLSCETDIDLVCSGGALGGIFDEGDFSGVGGFSALIYTGVDQVPEVPLPATLPLLAAGLLAVGWIGRRRYFD